MKVYKDKQFLVFEFEDGKTVKYDFATNQTIGKKGKVVNDLKSQLKGYTIEHLIEDCVDKNYGRFLKFIKDDYSNNKFYISNIGTVLEKVEQYKKYEQIFSAGVKKVKRDIRVGFKDIPKGLIKLCKEKDCELNQHLIDDYTYSPNVFNVVFNIDYISLTDYDIFKIINCDYENDSSTNYKYKSKVLQLVNEYGYNIKPLFKYFDYLATHEALDMYVIISNLYDYVKMMSQISGKYDKYPKNLLTSHAISVRTYNRLKIKFDEEKFSNVRDESLEMTYKDYVFIYPKTTQDIKDESVQMHNCVSSYVQRVLDGQCHILFLRHKKEPDKSLVTIEVRNNKIVQAYRICNTPITKGDQEAIEAWNNKNNKKGERSIMLLVGDKIECKLEMDGVIKVGEVCEITDINKTRIEFKFQKYHKGVVSYDEFEMYFDKL